MVGLALTRVGDREHQKRLLLKERIDVLGIVIFRNYPVLDGLRLEETHHLSRCCAAFPVTDLTLPCHDTVDKLCAPM